MSVLWGVLPSAAAGASRSAPSTVPFHRTRLGDRVVVWSSTAGAAEELRRAGTAPRSAGGLALVTQVGRSFQNAAPDARVVLDHGRHLVVDSDTLPDELDEPSDHWRIEVLPADATVVGRPRADAVRTDPATAALVDEVSPQRCEADLTWLVGLGTRHSLSSGFTSAATWASERLTALGFATARHPVTVGPGRSENVVADRPGSGAGPRRLVLVTAHLDSVNIAGGPSAPAPGADDNGSGSAGLLELARLLGVHQWDHDLRLILFGGEEQGLHGSRQYVASLPAAERLRVRAVLNMDMVATRNTPLPAVLLEGAPLSSGLIDDLAASAATYTGLQVETSLNPFASDHVPFLDAGMPAVLTIEGVDSGNGHIHTAQDVMAHIDLALLREILRMNLATCARWLGPVATSPRPAGPVVARAPGRLDVMVTGTDGALHHKAWDGAAWQPGTTGWTPLGRAGTGRRAH